MSQTEPTIVTSWDSMPPEVCADGEVFSTRVLAAQHKKADERVEELEALVAEHTKVNLQACLVVDDQSKLIKQLMEQLKTCKAD
jgi:hypothetical protein